MAQVRIAISLAALAIASTAVLGCSRRPPLTEATANICLLSQRGGELDGHRLRLQAIAQLSGHGASLRQLDCWDRSINLDMTEAAATSDQGRALEEAAGKLRWAPPFQSIAVDASGVFYWRAAPHPLTGAYTGLMRGLFVIDELHSFTLVDNNLRTACSLLGRSDGFCDCLQGRLGSGVTTEYADALTAMGVGITLDGQSLQQAIAAAPYLDAQTRSVFVECAVNRTW